MTTTDDRMARAGDYVLGLMDDDARDRAERDMMVDDEFRNCVMALAVRMQALDRSAGTETLPEGMWRAIEQRIADLPQMRGALPEPAAAPVGSERRRAGTRASRQRPWRGGGWQGLALAAGLAAVLGIGYLGGRMSATGAEPVVVVILNDDQQLPGAIVEAYADDAVRIVPLREFDVPAGKTLEVWTLYDQAVGPVSLGTFDRPREITLHGPDLPRPKREQLYEITLEDAPGSPVGRPTGPILAKGLAVAPVR